MKSPSSGLFELVVDNDSDGTLLASVIAKEIGGNCLWMTAPQDFKPSLMHNLDVAGWSPADITVPQTIGAAFAAIRSLSRASAGYSMIVLDSLAGLRGDHPAAGHIAQYVEQAIAGLKPEIPVLVVNQWRNPAPPGGIWWRERVVSRRLHNVWEWPTMSWMQGTDKWLFWCPPLAPEFRALTEGDPCFGDPRFVKEDLAGEWIVDV